MILLKKALRSMLRQKRAYLSCILLIAIGVWTYTVMNTALIEIEEGKNAYYADRRLGDVFATVKQIPQNSLGRLRAIEGVKQVDGRLIQNVRVLLEDQPEDPIKLRLISTDKTASGLRLNDYKLTGEDLFSPEDLLVGKDFFMAHFAGEKEDIALLINQKVQRFKVTGYVSSPEYVYIVENASELFSDATKYNIAFMDESVMMNLLGLEGIYNDLSFALEEGVVFEEVKDLLRDELEPYGLVNLYDREDLFSYKMLEEEISSGYSISTTLPMSFVAMAAIVLYLMMKRLIEQDRTQIGTLKAFGYSRWVILLHYMMYGLITGVIGVVLGLLVSYVSVSPYIGVYLDFYKLPISSDVNHFKYFYMSGIMGVLGGGMGAFLGAKSVIALNPAEAMRPKAPKAVKRDIKKLLPFLLYILNSRGFIAIRNIERSKVRSAFVVLGIVFSFSMIVMIGMMTDLIDSMFTNQFTHVLKYDAEMVFNQMMDYDTAVQEAMARDEIHYAEGILKIPVSMSNGHHNKGAELIGLKADGQLYKVYDDTRRINLKLGRDGIILGSTLSKKLEVKKGDFIYMSSPFWQDEMKIYVDEVVNQNIGSSAYMDLEHLSHLLNQKALVNALVIQSDDTAKLREALLSSSTIVKIEDKAKTLKMYEDLLDSFDFMIVFIQWIAVLISFIIIYNTAIISMSERSREYATLRVLGLSLSEVKEIMNFEYWVLCVIGILLGVPFARLINMGLINMMDIEVFAWPSEIPSYAYFVGAIGCILSVWLSNQTSARAIKKLDLVEVLKERE